MKSPIRILAMVAVLQLILVGVAYMGSSDLTPAQSGSSLLNFDTATVDSIMIEDSDHNATALNKHDGWKTAGKFPANGEKIDMLLQRLHGLKHGLAIASATTSLPRFKVAEHDFERHLTLKKGDKVLAELYLGKGAGARQSYVRNAQDHAVYSVALGSYELPVTVDAWQDKSLLQISSNLVTALKIGDVELTKQVTKPTATDHQKATSVWGSAQLPANQQVNQKAVANVLAGLQNLRFSKVLGKTATATDGMDHPVLEFDVSYQSKKRHYRFGKRKNEYVLHVSDRDEYFLMNTTTVKALQNQMGRKAWFVDKAVEKVVTEPAKKQ